MKVVINLDMMKKANGLYNKQKKFGIGNQKIVLFVVLKTNFRKLTLQLVKILSFKVSIYLISVKIVKMKKNIKLNLVQTAYILMNQQEVT